MLKYKDKAKSSEQNHPEIFKNTVHWLINTTTRCILLIQELNHKNCIVVREFLRY